MSFFDSFNEKSLTYKNESVITEINIDDINQGISQNDNFLFYRKNELIKIYDRVCDHNGGKLFLQGLNGICPLHAWEFDLNKGKYINNSCPKLPLISINESELDSQFIEVSVKKHKLNLSGFKSKKEFTIRFINHACLHFNIENKFSFATDPWVLGSAFCNGWWLSKESPEDVFNILNECDFIYISHNHPDHLHPESLAYIRKDMPILTAGFKTESTKQLLKEYGFSDIKDMNFTNRYLDESSEFSIAVLKSGDFRDDSGLLIEIGEFSSLLTVDSNFLNFGKLPDVDLIASSFSGGASGFPLCFDNYTENEKRLLIKRNTNARKTTLKKNIKSTSAKYFLPYAGFFLEKAKRDKYIKESNVKNKINDYEEICYENSCDLLNVDENQIFKFEGKKIKEKIKDESKKFLDKPLEFYLDRNTKVYKRRLIPLIKSYFQSCNFQDSLLLDLQITCDSFKSVEESYMINFNSPETVVLENHIEKNNLEKYSLNKKLRYLQIKVRRNELLSVLLNGKPWEELLIGFQCRIFRKPNIYNSRFWFHFNNIYISTNVRKKIN